MHQDSEEVLLMLRNLVKKQLRSKPSFESRARYAHSKHGKYIKLDVLRRYRFAYTLKNEGKARREITSDQMKFRKSKQLPSMRVTTRDLTAAKEILGYVAKGMFPGTVTGDA